MARYGSIGAGTRIFTLILLIVGLLIGGVIWFDQIGILDVNDILSPVLKFAGFPGRSKMENLEDPDLLDRVRYDKQWEALAMQKEELENRKIDLDQKEQDMNILMEALKEKDEEYAEKEIILNDEIENNDTKNRNLEANARKLMGMPPDNAVAILESMEDDLDIIDHLKMVDKIAAENDEVSMVAFWMSKMEKKRAAEILRLMKEE